MFLQAKNKFLFIYLLFIAYQSVLNYIRHFSNSCTKILTFPTSDADWNPIEDSDPSMRPNIF